MARIVTHEADSPLKIDAEDIDEKYGNVAICRCGLAESYPFCDGSHRVTKSEDEGTLYRYTSDDSDEDGDSDADDGARSRRVVERIVDAEG